MEDDRILNEPYFVTFREQSRVERRNRLSSENIVLTFAGDYSIDQKEKEVERLRKLNYAPVSLRFILGGVSYIATSESKNMPFPEYKSSKDLEGLSKKVRTDILNQQNTYINEIIPRVLIQKDKEKNLVRLYVVNKNGEKVDVSAEVDKFISGTNATVDAHYANRIYIGRAIGVLKQFMEDNSGILAILDGPIFNPRGPSIQVQDYSSAEKFFNQKQADRIIAARTDIATHGGILREVIRYGELNARREALQEGIDSGNIKLTNAFKKDNWPSHPLMTRIKGLSLPIIASEVQKRKVLCDDQDIRFQTLFRLSTIPLSQLFYHGDDLQQELLRQGSYYSWQNIPKISDVFLEQFQLREDVVRMVVQEQLLIIQDRLKNSDLPLTDILVRKGIFGEEDWKVVKRDNNIYVFNEKTKQQIPVFFRQIDNSLAKSFHRDLHYIHAPRSDMSFALFLENQLDLPFSVLGIQKTDRIYKQNVLLALGYDPRYCVDFTRLYNRPGAPFNTSSAIFACVFQYLEKNNPNIQAALSAFMPTYTSGLSMISGGFDTPVMVKDNIQTFQLKQLEGTPVWEHLTSRQQEKDVPSIKSVLPMLPTIELLRPIREQRFEPLRGVKGKMFEV